MTTLTAITFPNTIGRRDSKNRKIAEAEYRKDFPNDPIKKRKQQLHHINWRKDDPRPENLILARDQEEHSRWHGEMIEALSAFIDNNLLRFDRDSRQYYTDDKYVIDTLTRGKND